MAERHQTDQTHQLDLRPATVGWELLVAGASDAGRVRSRNEDSIHVEPTNSPDALERGWFGAVADGLGGRQAGEVASRLAVTTAREVFYRLAGNPSERLESAVLEANRAIHREARRRPDRAGMGSTITAATIFGGRLYLAQVGDSRAYLLRTDDLGSKIASLTRDHSWVADSVRAGVLTEEQSRHHPRRNLLTRVLGEHPEVKVDLHERILLPGDVLILCTDGLHAVVEREVIGRNVHDDPHRAVQALIALANGFGGPDNISVLVARVRFAGARPVRNQGVIQYVLADSSNRVVSTPWPSRHAIPLLAIAAAAALITFLLLLGVEQLMRDNPKLAPPVAVLTPWPFTVAPLILGSAIGSHPSAQLGREEATLRA